MIHQLHKNEYSWMENNVKLTTRGQYALTAMIELGQHSAGAPVRLASISEKRDISLSYLEQLVAALRKHGLVKSYRGPGGGYILARPLSEIAIKDILIAAEDSTPAKRTVKNGGAKKQCEHAEALWSNIGGLLYVFLDKISLEDVLQKRIHTHPYTSKIFDILR